MGRPMARDVLLSVMGGHSLRLHKVRNFLEPLVLTFQADEDLNVTRSFEFSLASINDVTGRWAQMSGHYSMTVDSVIGDLDRFLGIREIHFTQGVKVARLDVLFSDELELNAIKNSCDKIWKERCLNEKKTFVEAGHREAEVVKCIEDWDSYLSRHRDLKSSDDLTRQEQLE